MADMDSDGVVDKDDNCSTIANADQADADANGIGDACDTADAGGTGGSGGTGGGSGTGSGTGATETPSPAGTPEITLRGEAISGDLVMVSEVTSVEVGYQLRNVDATGGRPEWIVEGVDAGKISAAIEDGKLKVTGVHEIDSTTFILKAQRGGGVLAEKEVEVRVVANPPVITALSLPEVWVGQGTPTEIGLSATNGSGNFTWTVSCGSCGGNAVEIKDGNKLSITPGRIGEYAVTVTVADAVTGRTVPQNLTLTVSEDVAVAAYIKDGDGNYGESPAGDNAEVEYGNKVAFFVNGQDERYGCELSNGGKCGDLQLTISGDTGTSDAEVEGKGRLACEVNLQAGSAIPEAGITCSISVKVSGHSIRGDSKTKVLANMRFKPDPCVVPLKIFVVDTDADPEEVEEITEDEFDLGTVRKGQLLCERFRVRGGSGKYEWKFPDDWELNIANNEAAICKTLENSLGAGEFSVTVNDAQCDGQSLTKQFSYEKVCQMGGGAMRIHVLYYFGGDSSFDDHDVCGDTTSRFFLNGAGEVSFPGEPYYVDPGPGDNGTVDDASPEFTVQVPEGVCVEDLNQFNWWIDGDAGYYYPDIWVEKMVVEWCPGRMNDFSYGDNRCRWASWGSTPYDVDGFMDGVGDCGIITDWCWNTDGATPMGDASGDISGHNTYTQPLNSCVNSDGEASNWCPKDPYSNHGEGWWR
jgi:hypothetical protein